MVLAYYNLNDNDIMKSFSVMQSKDEKIAFLQKAIDITGKLQKLMVIFRKLVLTLDQV